MKRILAMLLLATACVVGATPGFARGGGGHGGFGGGFGHMGTVRNPSTLLGAQAPATPSFQSRIPSPLASPSQAPAINGPLGRSPYGGVM
jgi:hypothetical protein